MRTPDLNIRISITKHVKQNQIVTSDGNEESKSINSKTKTKQKKVKKTKKQNIKQNEPKKSDLKLVENILNKPNSALV